MKKIRLGIVCPAEIAYRRFMPALQMSDEFEYVGVGHVGDKEVEGDRAVKDRVIADAAVKAQQFYDVYGGKIFSSYEDVIKSDELDAVYIPLPPALHFKWAKAALENNKHVFLEKPFTTKLSDTEELIHMAFAKRLALHENYMFRFHKQIAEIADMVARGDIGDVRLYRIAFGFPKRAEGDFRYNKQLGGGALLDCGGYTLKLANILLGGNAEVKTSRLNVPKGYDVDLYGNATLENAAGVVAQVAFGMDNAYKCELEVWGSKGVIRTNRILTAPVGFVPQAEVIVGQEQRIIDLSADDSFQKSIKCFHDCIAYEQKRINNYTDIEKQARLLESVRR